jgi:phage regulator Rha-like protein
VGESYVNVYRQLEKITAERDAARAEAQKLRGWVREAEQAAGREQRRAEQAEAEVAALVARAALAAGGGK